MHVSSYDDKKKKSAILSVADKSGLYELATQLVSLNYTLYASSGTYQYLKKENFVSQELHCIDEITGVNPMIKGKVKTLSYSLLAGVLYNRDDASECLELENLSIPSIDVVVCNFYPEEIDIGGPNLIRAAIKNSKFVTPLVDPKDYPYFGKLEDNAYFISKAYQVLVGDLINLGTKGPLMKLEYGENPHQKAYASISLNPSSTSMSYNNHHDIAVGAKLLSPNRNSLAIIKHQIPCCYIESSCLQGNELLERAFEIDATSAYGGVVVSNNDLPLESFPKKFFDVVVTPNRIGKGRKLISLATSLLTVPLSLSTTSLGLTVQETDTVLSSSYTVLSGSPLSLPLANFSEKIVRLLKSNALVITAEMKNSDLLLLGLGSGQPNRVDCFTRLALPKALEAISRLKKFYPEIDDRRRWLIFSDGFFPFADSLEEFLRHEITNVIAPMGSKRDEEVINYALEHKMNFSSTPFRHFTH